jgi:hypothetical protein
MRLPIRLFLTGVPGSRWSMVYQYLEQIPGMKTSDARWHEVGDSKSSVSTMMTVKNSVTMLAEITQENRCILERLRASHGLALFSADWRENTFGCRVEPARAWPAPWSPSSGNAPPLLTSDDGHGGPWQAHGAHHVWFHFRCHPITGAATGLLAMFPLLPNSHGLLPGRHKSPLRSNLSKRCVMAHAGQISYRPEDGPFAHLCPFV